MTGWNNERLEKLAEMARTGDRKAFSEIVSIMMQPIVTLTYKMTGDRDAAKDLAQDTFVSAWSAINSFRGDAKVTSWLFRIASNKSLNYLNSRAVKDSRPLDEESGIDQIAAASANPDANLDQSEMRQRFFEFMQTLPPKQRLAFELRFYKEMTFDEIAEATDSALGTAKTNYRQAIAKLKVYAKERGWK